MYNHGLPGGSQGIPPSGSHKFQGLVAPSYGRKNSTAQAFTGSSASFLLSKSQ